MVSLLQALPMVGDVVNKLVDRIPDPAARERAKLEAEATLLKAAVEQAQQQTEINQVEAAHPSLLVAGWRPAIGWIGVFGLAYTYLFQPFAVGFGWTELPKLDGNLYELVVAMLGLGGLRTFEKWKGLTR